MQLKKKSEPYRYVNVTRTYWRKSSYASDILVRERSIKTEYFHSCLKALYIATHALLSGLLWPVLGTAEEVGSIKNGDGTATCSFSIQVYS